jgi:hypothetical protein
MCVCCLFSNLQFSKWLLVGISEACRFGMLSMKCLLFVLVVLSLFTCTMTSVVITNPTVSACGGAGTLTIGYGTIGTTSASQFMVGDCDWKLTAYPSNTWLRLTFTKLDIGSFSKNWYQTTRVNVNLAGFPDAVGSGHVVFRGGVPAGTICAAPWDTTCAQPTWLRGAGGSERSTFTVSASTGASNLVSSTDNYWDSQGTATVQWIGGPLATGTTGHTGFTIRWIELQVCEAGTYNSPSGSPACLACPAGTSSLSGSRSIKDCACGAGFTGVGTCVGCVAGKFKSDVGTNACTDCPVGTFSVNVSATTAATCVSCPANKYSDTVGGSAVSTCLSCPSNTNAPSSSTAVTACACNAGFRIHGSKRRIMRSVRCRQVQDDDWQRCLHGLWYSDVLGCGRG